VSLYSSSLELYAPGDEPSRQIRMPLQVLQLTAIVTISENLEEPHALRLAVAGPRGPATHELQFFSDADADHLRVSIRAARRTLLRSMQVPRSKSDELLDAELHRSFSAFGMDTAAIGAGSTPSRPAAIVEGRAAHAATPTAAEEQPAGSEGRGPAAAPPEADGEEALPAEAARPAEQARPPTEATGEGAGAAAGGDASPAAEADHEEDLDLLLGEGGGVRAASPARLIELLVHPSRFDHRFCSALLLTYRSFFTPAELLRELTGRCSLPTALEGREGAGEGAALQPVRLMVCNVLQKWVRHYLRDDEMTPELLEALHSFVDGPLAESEQTRALSALLKRAVAKRTVRRRSGPRAGRSQAPAPALTRSFDSDPPLPLFDLDGFGALDRVASVHPREWARQLTRREFDLLERIGPSELLRQAWAGAEKKARAPNVLALVGLANATAAWVASVVLSEAELCARAEAYGHLVDVAAECLALRNFNGVCTALASLELGPPIKSGRSFA